MLSRINVIFHETYLLSILLYLRAFEEIFVPVQANRVVTVLYNIFVQVVILWIFACISHIMNICIHEFYAMIVVSNNELLNSIKYGKKIVSVSICTDPV